jgi:hypothetical protein
MKWFCIVPILLSGCASVKQEGNYGFFPPPGMQEDAQDRYNSKYNLLDSSDGSEDPNANIKVWKAEY